MNSDAAAPKEAYQPPLTVERCRELLRYDESVGIFTWRIDRNSGIKAGDRAGYIARRHGYRLINLDDSPYLEHRLAWYYVHGIWPGHIDHIDGNPANNRIANLRVVSRAVNNQNRARPSHHNTSGFLGVHRHRDKFQAKIKVDGKYRYLGTFATPQEAYAVYVAAKRRVHAGFVEARFA